MKFEYLREFATAAQCEELQLGAKRIGISPSVLSKHIKTMEQELGVPLFMRSRKTELSPYGKILLPYAKELVSLQDEYLRTFSSETPQTSANLVVAVSAIQFRERAGRLLEQFMLTHPKNIQLKEADNSLLLQMVLDGECDVALVRSQPTDPRDPNLIYMPFSSDDMVVAFPPDHPLADMPSVTLEQLKDEQIYLRSETSTIYRVTKERCREHGFDPEIKCASTYVVYDLVRRRKGVTLYFSPPLETNRHMQQLPYVPIRPSIISFVDIVFRRGQLTDTAIELLNFAHASSIERHRTPDAAP